MNTSRNERPGLPQWATDGELPPDLQRKLAQSILHTDQQAHAAEASARLKPPFVIEEAAAVTPQELRRAIKLQRQDLQYVRVSTGVLLLVAVLGALDLLARANELRKLLGVIRRRLTGDALRLKGK
jgi:hypothetical protein